MTRAAQSRARQLRDVYASLRRHFGYAPRWWPGSPLEIALSAILVQQCDWSAAWKGVIRLGNEGFLRLSALAAADPTRLQPCIRETAFAPTKSRRLVCFAQALAARGHEQIDSYLAIGQDTQALRADLLSLDGIGQETADCILLFAGEHATFVVDAYTRRALERLGLFPESGSVSAAAYRDVKEFFERLILDNLSLYAEFEYPSQVSREVALLRDLHAQFVELGKHHCLKSRPRCRGSGQKGWLDYSICEPHCRETECHECPLVHSCVFGRGSADC